MIVPMHFDAYAPSLPVPTVENAAEQVCQLYGDFFRYEKKKLIYYDGHLWTGSAHQVIEHRMVCNVMEALGIYGNLSNINRILALLRRNPALQVTAEYFDRNPRLVNCLNGTLVLPQPGSGTRVELRPHAASDFITNVTNCRYDPDAAAPLLHATLETVLPNPDSRRQLQQVLGSCLYGTYDRKRVVLHGPDFAGIDAVLYGVRHALGTYAEWPITYYRDPHPGLRLLRVDRRNKPSFHKHLSPSLVVVTDYTGKSNPEKPQIKFPYIAWDAKYRWADSEFDGIFAWLLAGALM